MITVQALLDTESLGLKGIAGLAGTHRFITWAHAVDLSDPWRWVSAGNLVMTTGVGIPKSPKEQESWLERLAQTNCSALVVAPQVGAPRLSKRMLDAADRLMFPVLGASFELEFVKLSHYVIESVLQAQRESLQASQRLFQTYAEAMREHPSMSDRLSVLARSLGMALRIEDAGSGAAIFASDTSPYRKSVQAFDGESIAIGGRTRANLVIRREKQKALEDPLVVRSLVGLLGVELERLMINRDNQRDEGEDLLRSLLNDDTDFAVVRPILERRGLTGTLVCLAIRPATRGEWPPSEIHQAPGLQEGTPLFLQDDVLLVLSPDNPETLVALAQGLGTGTAIGISGAVTVATGFRESVRQARLALVQAIEREVATLRYGEAETGLIMAPKSLPEARALVGRYLGPLIEHDRLHDTSLLSTLLKFLANDGNFKETAFDLGIHRQTLVYRLKLVEQFTGLKPTGTDGTARFWIALTAGRQAKLIPE